MATHASIRSHKSMLIILSRGSLTLHIKHTHLRRNSIIPTTCEKLISEWTKSWPVFTTNDWFFTNDWLSSWATLSSFARVTCEFYRSNLVKFAVLSNNNYVYRIKHMYICIWRSAIFTLTRSEKWNSRSDVTFQDRVSSFASGFVGLSLNQFIL